VDDVSNVRDDEDDTEPSIPPVSRPREPLLPPPSTQAPIERPTRPAAPSPSVPAPAPNRNGGGGGTTDDATGGVRALW
jgi:hypothetical protein